MIQILIESQRARDALIWLCTCEEDRAMTDLQKVAASISLELFAWDCIHGFRSVANHELRPPNCDGSTNIGAVLQTIGSYNGVPAIFVLRDISLLLERYSHTPEFVVLRRRLQDLARDLKKGRNTVILLCPSLTIPPEIEQCVRVIEHPLPTFREFSGLILDWLVANGYRDRCRLDETGMSLLAQALSGLTADQAYAVLAHSLVRRGVIDEQTIDDVIEEKRHIIKKTGILELVEARETFENVGGLSSLKAWLAKRAAAFSPAAAAYGLPPLKGVLLAGIPGTGKSLIAKAIANAWHMPLLRLDVGRLFGSLVGESEERQRRAILIAEGVSPCVLHIDEIEKGFGGMAEPAGDGGVSRRLFGSLLTWLQEKTKPVFVAATANDISQLPPELIRKGRWDEVFFTDLPTEEERREILSVLLKRYGRNPDGLITGSLLMKLDRYSGAEIEQVIKEALFEAFHDERRQITTEDLEGAIGRVVPIADQMQQRLGALREWGRRNARPAS